ncbi:MAG: 1-deoxy-D-xylulose-5-phosphate reductoisomerase [Desulfosalsimonas sp.]
MKRRRIGILGSTGSIGRNTLEVLGRFPDRFSVNALTAGANIELLARQIEKFRPEVAAVYDEQGRRAIKELLPPATETEILCGQEGYIAAATLGDLDLVVSAMVGSAGLRPTMEAVWAGRDIALANKEVLVMAGELVMKEAEARGVSIIPVDSEHSAVMQCMSGSKRADVDRIMLTASGGPFLDRPGSDFSQITPSDALAHPTWQMGDKITIDSATLMNKGLEVIEAAHLFGLSPEKIEVVVHPQSIVHSMVAFCDGTVMAQMGLPDMKAAIAYAISCPERLPLGLSTPDFARLGSLTFRAPDLEKFSCLALDYRACRAGGTMPAVMNAANEVAVDSFLKGKTGFDRIPAVIEEVMNRRGSAPQAGMDDIMEADLAARRMAESALAR